MKIFHISDTHVGGEKHFDKSNFDKILKKAEDDEYDFLIHTGDLTQGGKLEEYRLARNLFNEIKIPYVIIPGNHDVRSGGLHLFKEFIGNSNGVREIGDAVVIYVNSAVADSDEGRVGMVKYNLLRDSLNEYSNKPIKIVALHHHVVPIPKAGRERNVLYNAGDILDLLIRGDVDLVLSGHRHYPNVYKVENTVFINAGTSSSTKTRYGDINSYNIINIDGNSQEVITRRVDGSEVVNKFKREDRRIFSDFGERKFRFVHVSNTFISNSRVFLKNHFENALDTVDELSPDLIVHCGGIVREGTPQDYDYALNYLNNINIPVVYTPAGRDINYLGYHLFTNYFGPFDQKFTNGEILFQGISSSQYDSPIGIVGNTERKGLINKLNRSTERIKIIFLHHNVIPIPHSREKGLLEDSGDLLREIVDSQIDIVLTGTSSHPYAAKVCDTVIINANSLSSIYQRSVFGNSFNLIDIFEDAIAVFEINSLWGKRKLLGMWELDKKN